MIFSAEITGYLNFYSNYKNVITKGVIKWPIKCYLRVINKHSNSIIFKPNSKPKLMKLSELLVAIDYALQVECSSTPKIELQRNRLQLLSLARACPVKCECSAGLCYRSARLRLVRGRQVDYIHPRFDINTTDTELFDSSANCFII